MSDVADFTGVSAGSTSLLATGVVNADNGGVFTLAATNIPTTTRALLLLVLPTAITGGVETYSIPRATGNVSLQSWRPAAIGAGWEAEGNITGQVQPDAPMAPLYFPFYGLVDTGVTVRWAVTAGGSAADAVRYWLLGLPDPAIAGSDMSPLSVANPLTPADGIPQPLSVMLTESNGNLEVGTEASPLYVSERDPVPTVAHVTSTVTAASGITANLVPAPSAGNVTEIVTINLAAGTTAASAVQQGIVQISGVPILRFYATAAGVSVNSDARILTTGSVDLRNIGVPVTVVATVVYRNLPLV